jgi:hypothetical protein
VNTDHKSVYNRSICYRPSSALAGKSSATIAPDYYDHPWPTVVCSRETNDCTALTKDEYGRANHCTLGRSLPGSIIERRLCKSIVSMLADATFAKSKIKYTKPEL